MNCNSCGRVVFQNASMCQCGAKIFRTPTFSQPKYAPNTASIVARKFAERLEEVNAYVDEYRTNNPGSTKRDACLVYLRERGLMSALPKHLQDPEAIAERKAIQAEA